MSRFSRAFQAALASASPPLTQADAARIVGYHTSKISRVLTDHTPPTPEHISTLLRAIDNEQDREHCLTEYLHDCCPTEYQDELRISLGKLRENKPIHSVGRDPLSQHMAALEQLAQGNHQLRELIKIVLKLLQPKA